MAQCKMFLLTYTLPYWRRPWKLSIMSFMEAKAVNNPPKNVTLKKEECGALLGRRDVLLDYVRDTSVLKLGALFEIHFSQISLVLFAKALREGFIFSFMIP